MTTILIAIACLGVGYLIGRVRSVGLHIERDFQDWRDRITAASLRPIPAVVDLRPDEWSEA